MVYHQKLASVFVFLLVAGGLAVFLTFGLPQDSSVPLTGDSASQSGGDPYSANSFFVVLKANEPLLKFSRNTNTGFRVMNSTSLDNVVAAHNVIDMQALLPQALDKHVGENGIHLNRVYMAFMNATAGRSTRDAALVAFSNLSSVKLAEPIGIISEPDFTPDDPYFNDPPGIFGVQHNLVMTKAALAWDFFDIEGGQFPGTLNGEFPDYEGILLASNDQGVDYTHPDLIDNLWVNQLEVAEAVVGEEVFSAVDTDGNNALSGRELHNWVVNGGHDFNNDNVLNLRDVLAESSPFINGIDDDCNPEVLGCDEPFEYSEDEIEEPIILEGGYPDDIFGYDIQGPNPASAVEHTMIPDHDPYAPSETHGARVAGVLAGVTDNSLGIASSICIKAATAYCLYAL